MRTGISKGLFRRLVGTMLYYADTEFLASAIGYRALNSKVFWIKKNIIQLLEDGFGREYFSADYSDTKDILNESDYLGIILKIDLRDDLFHVYLKNIYRSDEFPEFTMAVEKYVKDNPGKCLKLFFGVFLKKFKQFPHKLYDLALDTADLNRMELYKKYISIIASSLKGKKAGIAAGLDRKYQANFFKPVMSAFIERGMPFIHISEEESRRKNTSLAQKEGYFVFKIKMPTRREMFKNRGYLDGFRNDLSLLRGRISRSNIAESYKKFLMKKLDKHLERYYKMRFFLDEFMKGIDIAFAFALPDRFIFQRTLLMMCKRRGIPTFTYDPYFNMSETVLIWYYFSDWVLLANKKHVDMIVENGFSKNRARHIGSTLADCYMTDKDATGGEKEGVSVLLLTKPAHRTGFKNDAVIDETLRVLENAGAAYALYIKPHPSDSDLYSRYTRKRGGGVSVLGRDEPLYRYVPGMTCLVACGITGAILDCLPSKKPIVIAEMTSSADKGIFSRGDLSKTVFFSQNLRDYSRFLSGLLNDLSKNIRREIDIPQSLIDDFYCSMDGRTGERVVDFVFSTINKR